MRERLLAFDVDHPVGASRDGKRTLVDPAGLLAGFVLQPGIEFDRIADQLGEVPCRTQGAHLSGGMPRGPRRQLVALQEDRVRYAVPGQVIERRTPHDATPYDDNGCPGGNIRHGSTSRQQVARSAGRMGTHDRVTRLRHDPHLHGSSGESEVTVHLVHRRFIDSVRPPKRAGEMPDGRRRTEMPMMTCRVVEDMDRPPRVHALRTASCNVCCDSHSNLVQLL